MSAYVDNRTDAERAEGLRLIRAMSTSPETKRIRLMAGIVRLGAELAREWLAEHTSQCGCEFCHAYGATGYGDLFDNIAGLRMLAGAASDLTFGELVFSDEKDYPTGHEEWPQAGDCLRELARRADAIEAEDEDADEPAVVESTGPGAAE